MISALTSTASAAIRSSFKDLESSAARVARGGLPDPEESVRQLEAQRAIEAQVAVLRTANELTGTVLDLFA